MTIPSLQVHIAAASWPFGARVDMQMTERATMG